MTRHIIGFGALLLAAAAPAFAARTPSQMIEGHLDALGKGDLDAVMADYADDAVMTFPLQIIEGKPGIRAFFAGIIARSKGQSFPQILKIWHQGDAGYVTWRNGAMEGSDEFLMKDDKIKVQAIYPGAAKPGS